MTLPKNPNLWKTLETKPAFSSAWIEARECSVINPNGAEQPYSYVHFKNKAVGIAAVEDGHIWMVGQSRFALGQYSWELPEGGCPKGEDTLDTAKRELSEETGLSAAHYAPLLQMHLSNSCTDEWAIVYLATGLTQGDSHPEPSEDITTAKITIEQAYAAVEAGDITDSMSVAAIYKLMLLKSQNAL